MQTNITKYAKKQDSKIHNEEKNQSIQNDSEITEMLELVDKDKRMVCITIFCMFKKLKDKENMLNRHGIYLIPCNTYLSRYKN